MYQQPSSSPSTSQASMPATRNNLTRYGSAPVSFLSAALDSREDSKNQQRLRMGQMDDYKSNNGGGLIRQSSSPAGFFINHLNNANSSPTHSSGNGPKGGAGNSYSKGGMPRLNSQQSFTRQDSVLSHISEEKSENGVDRNNGHTRKTASSYGHTTYELCSWPDDHSNSIVFSSSPSSKHAKNINGDVILRLNREESQLHFGLHQSALEMAAMENLMHIPEDSVPCKIRAKRGFATHPRSIAERERRTRINGKLKKLEQLVPNMDKQTSYADMLDLAVQHIKGLQNQIQKLNSELEDCTCGCNQTT